MRQVSHRAGDDEREKREPQEGNRARRITLAAPFHHAPHRTSLAALLERSTHQGNRSANTRPRRMEKAFHRHDFMGKPLAV